MTKEIDTPLLTVAYEEDGDPGATPIVLVHGFPDDARTWDRVSAPLVRAGYRTIRPYVRGFGRTRFRDATTMRSGQIAAFAEDLVAFTDALRLDRYMLVGHDWGGRASYAVASLHPERLLGLVICAVGYATGAPVKDAGNALATEQARAFWYQWYFHTAQGRAALERDRGGFCRELWKKWSPSWKFSKAEYERTARSFANPDFVDVAVHSYTYRWGNAPADPRYAATEAKMAEGPKIRVPTTVLIGAEDGAALAKSSLGKEKHFAAAYKRRVLPGCGHFIPRERASEVAAAVRRHLTSL